MKENLPAPEKKISQETNNFSRGEGSGGAFSLDRVPDFKFSLLKNYR